MSHQCCLPDSFHCSPPDSRNAARARSRCARLVGTLRRPPGRQSASGRRGRGTATKPGPEAASPTRPAGTAPRDALVAECRWRKCHWSCCNTCSERQREMERRAGSFIRCPRLLSALSGSSSLCRYLWGVFFFFPPDTETPTCVNTPDSSNTTGALTQLQNAFSSVKTQRLKVRSHCR